MHKISNLDEISKGVANIKDKRLGFFTNFFLDNSKHSLWIQKGDCYCKSYDDTFFFIRDGGSFTNLFFVTTSLDSLQKDLSDLLSVLEPKVVVMDLIGRAKHLFSLIECLKQIRFQNLCNLVRMSRITPTIHPEEDFEKVSFAEVEDAPIILQILNKYFDKELEQLPYLEEIGQLVSNGNVLVVRDGVKITGFVMFEKSNSTLYLRYWFVLPEYRGRHIGGLLLRKFFFMGNGTRRQILWVVKSNENSLKRYIHYGFKEDGLEDKIFVHGNFKPNPLTTNNLNFINHYDNEETNHCDSE